MATPWPHGHGATGIPGHTPPSMARVLITGMSGGGKSTLLEAVADRGYPTVDTDYGGWGLADAQWDELRMSSLLAEQEADIIRYVSEVEPLIRVSATLELDGLLPVDALATTVSTACAPPDDYLSGATNGVERGAANLHPARARATRGWPGRQALAGRCTRT